MKQKMRKEEGDGDFQGGTGRFSTGWYKKDGNDCSESQNKKGLI